MPGTTDRMTRDVRASLKQCAAKGGKYFKGTAALFLRSGSEYVGGQLPTVTGMVDMNRELLQDTARFLRNPVDALNRTINKAMETEDFKALKRFAGNMIDDLKTGNLYDPDRVRSGFGEDIDSMLDSFGDFDMTGFDENGDWSESTGEEDWEKEIKLAEAQENSEDARTEATIDAIGTSTQAIVSTENANAQANIRLSLRRHSQVMAAAQNMITQQAAAVQAVNQTAASILDVTRETHQQIMENMKGITALLTEIRDNTRPPAPEKDKVREELEIFGNHGEINVKNLVKSAKKKMDEKYNISSMLSMATGGMSLADIIDTIGNDPWQIVTDQIFRRMLPNSLKRQFEITGKKLEGFFPALLTKWNEDGKKFDNGDSESLKDFFKGLLGYEARSKKYIDTSSRNMMSQAVFTNKTAKAIEEVIPQLIAQIHSDLSGDALKSFNYESGKFENVVDIISKQVNATNDLANRMGIAAGEFIDMTKAVRFVDPKMQDDFEKFRYQYLQKQAENSRFIDPYKSREEFMKTMPDIRENRELFSDIIQKALLTMDSNMLESLSTEIIDARRSRQNANASIHNNLRNNGTMIAFSGLLDQGLENKITSASKKTAGGLRGTELDKAVKEYWDTRERSDRVTAVPKANNILLNDIKSMLQRGIITYTYILGNSTNGFGDDTITSNATKAQKASADEWKRVDKRADRVQRDKDFEKERRDNQIARNRIKAKDPATEFREMLVSENGDVDFAVLEEMMRDVRINRAQREDGELIIDNTSVVKSDRDSYEGGQRALKKKMARFSEEINGRLDGNTFGGFMKRAQEYGKVPFELVENGLKLVDSFLFRVLYGEDASEVLLNEHKLPSILDAVRLNVRAEWLAAKDWFGDNIGDPIKKSLFDPKEGLFSKIADRLNEKVAEPIKNRVKKFRDNLIGTREKDKLVHPDGRTFIKDENGNWTDSNTKQRVSAEDVKNARKPDYSGGRFSSKINDVLHRADEIKTDTFNKVTGGIKGRFNKWLYGDNVEGKGVGHSLQQVGTTTTTRGYTDRTGYHEVEVTSPVFADAQEFTGIIGSLKRRALELRGMLFGEDENGDDHDSWNKYNMMKDELKKAFPDMTIGAGIGLLGSFFLPGGPIIGSLLGAATGFTASSDNFKKFLFGDFVQEDQEYFNMSTGRMEHHMVKTRGGTKSGGIISQQVYEGVKKFAPKVTIGSVMGAAAGGLGLLPFGMGPIIGGVLGSIGGMTAASDRLKQLIFGTYTDEDGNEKEGILGPKVRAAIKNAAGPALGGAALGSAAWGMISSIGIIPGLSLLPGGPIFALLGGITGAINADAIKGFFFGDEVESTEEVKDENGNVTGTKKTKKRVGGLFGKAFDFAQHKMLEPFANRINAAGAKVGEWFTKSVVMPFQNALQPMKDQMKRAGEAISESMKNIGQHIKDSITNIFKDPNDPDSPGFSLKTFFKEKVIGPLDRIVSGIFNSIGKVIGSIISAPFKAMELIFTGRINGETLDQINDRRAQERDAKKKEREKAKANKMASRRNSRVKGIGSRLFSRVNRIFGRKNESEAGATHTNTNVANDELERAMSKAGESNASPGVDVNRIRNSENAYANESRGKEKGNDASRDAVNRLEQHETIKAKEKADKEARSKASKEAVSEPTDGAESGKRRGIFKGKPNNTYLKEIANHTRAIYDEIKGQLGGLGWNTAYIKAAIDKKWGDKGKYLSDEELPEEMEGSKKVKKRRTLFGKAVDRVGGFFKGVGGRIHDLIEGTVEMVLTPFRLLGKAVEAVKNGVVGAGKALWEATKTMGSVFKELLLGMAKGIGGAIAGVGNMIRGVGRGLGEALGDVVSTITGVLHDGILALSGLVSGAIQLAGALIPEIGMGLWRGAGKLAGAAWKGAKGVAGLAWKGIRGIGHAAAKGAGWVKSKFTKKGQKDEDGQYVPGKNIYPIAISTKKDDGSGRTQFPIINLSMPVKPVHAIPVFLVGAFSDAILSTKPIEDQPETHATPAVDTDNRSTKSQELAAYKNKYFSVDNKAEKSMNPGEEYDSAMRRAKSMTEIQAIQASQQMNTGNQLALAAGGSGGDEEKKSGLLDTILQMFGLNDGGLSSILKSGLSLLGTKIGASTILGPIVRKARGVIGTAGSFVGTASSGLLPIALGTMIGKATGTEDRGVTNTARGISKIISNLFTDKTVIDAAGNITKVGWGSRIANTAHRLGARLLGNSVDDAVTAVPGAAQAASKTGLFSKIASGLSGTAKKAVDAGKSFLSRITGSASSAFTAAKNSDGLVGKILTKLTDMAQSVLSNPIVKRVIPTRFLEKGSKIISGFRKKLGEALSKVTTQSLEGFAKKLGVVVTVVTLAYDVVSGFNEAANILKIDSSALTVGMRAAAGIAKGLSGLAFGLIPVSWLTNFIYDIFADDDAEDMLDESQAKFKAAAAAAGMSVDEYNRSQNKSTWQSIKDTAGNAVNTVRSGWNSLTSAVSGFFGNGPGFNSDQDFGKGILTDAMQAFFSDPKSLFSGLLNIGRGIGASLIDMVTDVYKGKKNGPTIFNLMGEGLGNSLVADLKNTEGKNATITTSMATAMSATVAGTTTTEKKSFIQKIGSTASKLLPWNWGKGEGCEDSYDWGTGVKPMSQSSGKWNRGSDAMAKAGCGPTAAAMVASAYGAKNANPLEADRMSRGLGMRASDGGTNPAFYSQYAASHGFGMKQGPVDSSKISSSLRAGHPVVMMGKGGAYGRNMHYMVAESGKGDQVGLVDPLTGSRKSTTMGKLIGNTAATVYSYGRGRWGRGYEDEASNYDENGNLKGVSDQDAAKVAATAGISYAEAAETQRSGGNPLNKPFKVTSPFGKRNLAGKVEGHKGIDIVPTDGSGQAEVGSRWNGVVTYVKNNVKDSHKGLGVTTNTGGNMVFIQSDDGYLVKHMHLKYKSVPDAVKVGARVKIGQKIGDMGTTGRSTGPHLHYQLEDSKGPFDPYSNISGGNTITNFSNGTTTGTATTNVTSQSEGETNTGSTSGGFNSVATGVLSALSTVFSGVAGKLGNILTILMGGTPGDSDMESDPGGANTMAANGTTFNFGSSAGTTDPTQNKLQTWKWLRGEYGLTEQGAAGLMGCWQAESNVRPDRLEGDYLKPWRSKWSSITEVLSSNKNLNDYTLNYLFPAYDNSPKTAGKINKDGYRMADGNYYPGMGLAQWTKGRAYNLMKFALENGLDWRDLMSQLKFFKQETEQSYPNLKRDLNAAPTPEEGARVALDGFEMGKDWSSTEKGKQQWEERARYAAQIYNSYHGISAISDAEKQEQLEAARARRGVSADTNTASAIATKKIASTAAKSVKDIYDEARAKADENAETSAAGPGWGKGGPAVNLSANVSAMNNEIARINKRMEKVREDADKDSTVVAVTKKITEAISSTNENSSETEKMLAGFSALMAQMVEHLAAIRKNTEKTDDDTPSHDTTLPKVKTGTPTYPNGDNTAEDVGAAAINRMTGI